MSPFLLVSMVFTLILVLLVGGFVVTFPLVRRLGDGLDEWLRVRREERVSGSRAEELEREMREVRRRLEALEREAELLAERQRFTESLLEAPEPSAGDATPAGEGTGTG